MPKSSTHPSIVSDQVIANRVFEENITRLRTVDDFALPDLLFVIFSGQAFKITII